MRASYETITSGLDQLFFSPLVENESPLDRAGTIDTYLVSNGWTWDEYINELSNEQMTWTTLPLSQN
jgi:hypothetical protein